MDARDWVLAVTRPLPAPYVPQIVLHQGEDVIGLWERTEEWAGRAGLPPPFWAFAWAGGLGLARHVLDQPETVRGRRVLDLATGCGVVAVAAALAGAEDVVANDIDPLALAATRVNAARNGVRVVPLEADLVSGPEASFGTENDPLEDIDVVLAGDVFYDRDLAARMLPFLQRAAERGARVLVGDPGRRYLPRAQLLPLSRHEVPVPADLEGGDIATVTVWWLPARAEPDA